MKRENTRELFESIALTERMEARAAERRAKKAADAADAYLAAATGETAPAGEPPQIVDPVPPAPSTAGVDPTPPADQPPIDLAK